ncbi:phage tail protein [Buttiauxella sp. 3AFRM03]|uniref:phage major tail tube protein n=1 Tax=Buttiauxella sp. 3AFRM03 TaxID=2479367 RepID=UPI000EF79B6A|nr:phage major tail tube protein [Buttiauxella sp. 3AFRM03]AYN30012.1 phage tail protein [Buttiauxella sp. 3AFRM03]
MDLSFIYSKSSMWTQNGSRIGDLRSFTPPAMTGIIGDHKTTWMDTAMPVDTGMEPMQCTFKTGADPDVLSLFGFIPTATTRIQMRRTYKDSNGALLTFTDELEGIIATIESDEHGTDGQEAVGCTVTMRLSYYRLTINDQEIYEIDPKNMIRAVRGVNTLQAEKDALLM